MIFTSYKVPVILLLFVFIVAVVVVVVFCLILLAKIMELLFIVQSSYLFI